MARSTTYFALSFLLIGTLPAAAAEHAIRSKVDGVTVFPAGAEVTRAFDVSLEPGAHVIAIADLPASVVENSIRVEGESAGSLEISSVDARRIVVKKPGPAGSPDESERKSIEKEIQSLLDERAQLDGVILAADTQQQLAENLSRLPQSNWGKGGDRASTDWAALFDLIGSRIQATAKSAQDARVRQRELDGRVRVLKERLALEPKEEWERTEVRIHVEVPTAVKSTLRVRYHVEQARWQPVYDARLTTGKEPAVTIARRASITQGTGEDWDDATLTLSTMRPGGETSAPEPAAMKVAFKAEPAFVSTLKSQARAPSGPDGVGAAEMPAPLPPKPAPVTERRFIVENAPYQTTFKITQRVTVKSGVGQKKVFIAAETMKAALLVHTTPKLAATAFLHATFTYDGLAPILPGEVTLYRDGTFAGRGLFGLTAKGEEMELGFGRDDSVKVARVELKRAKGESGIISTSSTDEQHYKITVKNLHDWTVPVTVLDQVPVSEDEKIAVEVLPMTTEPSERNYEDKPGVLAWTFELAPQAEKDIALSYEIKWPAKREIVTGP